MYTSELHKGYLNLPIDSLPLQTNPKAYLKPSWWHPSFKLHGFTLELRLTYFHIGYVSNLFEERP